MKELPKPFFERDAVKVAKDLLGKIISVNGMKGRIVETEAYGKDPASHAFKRTERSALMFDSFGSIYVYLIYGMYWCLNFTTNPVGEAGAVLIRALEPIAGIDRMKKRRGNEKIEDLCSGPGKLCLALGIDKSFNSLKLGKEMKVYADGYQVRGIGKSSRVGIKDALELQWRFYIKRNRFVSKVTV